MDDFEVHRAYEEAKGDFREYTGTTQELPDLRIFGGAFLEGEPDYFSEAIVSPEKAEEISWERIKELQRNYEELNVLEKEEFKEGAIRVVEYYAKLRDDVPVKDIFSMGLPAGYDDMIDRENYSVVMGEEDFAKYDCDTIRDLMLGGLMIHAEVALSEAFEDVEEKILKQYSTQNPEIDIDGFYCDNTRGGGVYDGENIRLGLNRIDEVDFEEGEILNERLEALLYHEGIHAMQHSTNPMFDNFKNAIMRKSRDIDYGMEKLLGHSRAFFEAATTFETSREYGDFGDKKERTNEIRKAWEKGPEALKEYAENNEKEFLDNRYVFGQWVASVVNLYMRQNSEEPLEDTREWLTYGVTTANAMAGTAKKVYNNLDIEPPEPLDKIDSFEK